MSREYASVLAPYIAGFVATKRAGGYAYEKAEDHLLSFDRFCTRRIACKSLSREVVLEWAMARDGEGRRTRRTRMSTIRELGRYMQSIGVSDAFVLPVGLSPKVERYVPHFFTSQEIVAFFAACDRLRPYWATRARHLVLPALFRLLYCCGLRISEARTLRVEQVDLLAGRVDILHSKGSRSRRLPLPEDLLDLLKVYDARVSGIYPGRIYFFPTTRSACYSRSEVDTVFRSVWKAAGLEKEEGKRARPYDFRHHMAFTTLNRWIASDVDVNAMVPYLSKYMGHSSLESTDYYLHLVPEFFHTFREKVRSTETLLPELDYE